MVVVVVCFCVLLGLQGEAELVLAAGLRAACSHHLCQQLPHSTHQGGMAHTRV